MELIDKSSVVARVGSARFLNRFCSLTFSLLSPDVTTLIFTIQDQTNDNTPPTINIDINTTNTAETAVRKGKQIAERKTKTDWLKFEKSFQQTAGFAPKVMTFEETHLDKLTIASTSSCVDEEVELLLNTSKKPVAKARRLQSSRAASLFDPYCTDDEGLPLEVPTDDSSSSQASGPKCHPARSMALTVIDYDSVSVVESSLARLTESFASYLCGTVSDEDITTVRFQSNRSRAVEVSHSGVTLQGVLCSMPCNISSPLCSQSGHTELIHSPQHSKETCSDVALSDIRKALASDITAMLGSTTLSNTSWFSSLNPFWITSRQSNVKKSPIVPRRKIRNRCGLRSAQSARLRHLWYKWHCQSATDGNNPVEVSSWAHHLGNAKSFDDVISAFDFVSDEESLDLCYDSDPETFLRAPRSNTKPSRTPKRDYRSVNNRPGRIDTNASFGSICERPKPPMHGQKHASLSFDTRSFDTCPETKWSDDTDKSGHDEEDGKEPTRSEDPDRETVKEIMMGKVMLTYHPGKDQHFGSEISGVSKRTTGIPVAVQGWFEMGSRLSSKIVHPQFMWKEMFEPSLHPRRKLGFSCDSLELLGMVRILKPSELERDIYPYAKLSHTFVIHSQSGGIHVFESRSEYERDWFVHGLKLVVSRLASMIIVGDHQMFVEFFSPWALSPALDYLESESSSDLSSEDESEDEPPPRFFISTTTSDRKRLWGTANWSKG